MAITRSALTDSDIRTLVRGATDDERAAAAHKLCRRMDNGLAEEEREAAHEVLRMMATDAAELVRRALAVTLKTSTILPRDVALKLARDVDSISLPILHHSPVFTDEDLAEIVRVSPAVKQMAVARRATLGEPVTAALVEHGCEEAVKTACANDNALFSETALRHACERFAEAESVTAAIAFRKVLPMSIGEKLVDLVSEQVRQHLVDHHALSPETALQISIGTRERATVDLVDQAGRAADMRAFVAHLNKQDRLTPSLLLRAVAHGHMAFFEWSLAELAQVPHHRTWLMVHDAGALGLRAIYERSSLPARLYPAFRAAVDTYHVLQAEGGMGDLGQFQERMLQRFLTQPATAARDDLDYLIDRMDQLGRRARAAAVREPVKGAA
ncbi:MAG: hypothetical protein B7Y99_04095 [Caulobacterales bacterium 32-69-10]|nr:MAG: hypothetical protein B7Y99_04095 [Caulobacterales bacterium 32-69-10]